MADAGSSDSDDEKVESVGKMKQRHKRELKELDAQCKEMLHTFNKKDKNAKKEVQDKIKKLEDELKARHEQELHAKEDGGAAAALADAMREMELKKEEAAKKAAKRADEEAKRAAAERERRAQIEHELKDRVDHRAIENERLAKRLASKGLRVHEIISDGNCLYRAIAHQVDPSNANDFMVYRRLVEQHMRAHADDFLPYLADEETGDTMTLAQFDAYLADLVSDKAVWGGEPEASALAGALRRPVTIFRATDEPLTLGAEFSDAPPLLISWHQHYFGLGAHYNSIVKA